MLLECVALCKYLDVDGDGVDDLEFRILRSTDPSTWLSCYRSSIYVKGINDCSAPFNANRLHIEGWAYSSDVDQAVIVGGYCDPVTLNVESFSSGIATLSWRESEKADDYTVFGRIVGNSSFSTLTASGTSKFVGPLNPSKTYQWSVRANCPNYISELALPRTFSPPAARSKQKVVPIHREQLFKED